MRKYNEPLSDEEILFLSAQEQECIQRQMVNSTGQFEQIQHLQFMQEMFMMQEMLHHHLK